MKRWLRWKKAAAGPWGRWLRQMGEPLFGVAWAAVAGILLADWWPEGKIWAAAALLALTGLLAARRSWWVYAAVLTCFGWAHVMTLHDPLREMTERRLAPGGSTGATVTGLVADAPAASVTGNSWQFPLDVETLECGGESWPARHSRVYVRITEARTAPAYGDRIVLTGLLKRPAPLRNPGEFDFGGYLKRAGFSAEFLLENADGRWQRLATGQGNPVVAAALESRDWIARTVTRDLEDSPDIAATVRTMVLGTREKTPDDITDAFRASGTMHVFSVSGLHVALFAAVLWFTLGLTGLPRGWIIGLTIGLMFFYVFVTGLRPSAWRAAIMTSFFLIGPVWNREGNLFNSLAASALLLLGWQTQQLFQPGFTLSFGVLLAIAAFQKPLRVAADFLLGRWNAPDPMLPEELRNRWQKSWYWLRDKLCDSLSISTASTLGSMPLMIGYFNLVTPIGIFANLFLVMMSTGILIVACLSMATAAVGLPPLVLIWNNANWALAWSSIATAKFFAALPLGHVRVDPARLWRGDPCEVTVLALEHGGGAARIDTAAGRQWLIDCGGLKHWNRTMRPHLERAPVNRIEGVFLTHQDSYHTGALLPLTELFPPEKIWRTGTTGAPPGPALTAGESFPLDEGTRLEVLFPPAAWQAGVADDHAAVLRLECRGFRVLLMSDAGFLTEKALLASGQDLRADVLVMGRHGSDFCGLPEFIRAVQPGSLVFTNNRFPETERATEAWRERIAAQGIAIFDQALTGGVTLRMDDAGLRVKGFANEQEWQAGPKPPVPWSTLPQPPGPLIR